MYEQVERTPEKKSHMAATEVSQRQSSHAPTSRFVDNRPEAIQMQKLRELAKNSPKNNKLRELHHLAAAHSVTQKKRMGMKGFGFVDKRPENTQFKALQLMIGNSSGTNKNHSKLCGCSGCTGVRPQTLQKTASKQPLLQLKTTIKNQAQTYNFSTGSVLVGEKMEAWLDPKDMKRGQSASVNSSQNKLMKTIRKSWGITGGDVVKGHLLNDNLGGTALNNNLYPITRAANKDHLMYVENAVKRATWGDDAAGVYYKVQVNGVPNLTEAKAEFATTVQQWNPTTNALGGAEHKNIPSNFKEVASYHQAYDPSNIQDELDTIAGPDKDDDFDEPATRVRELTTDEKKVRNAQPVSSVVDGYLATHIDEKGNQYTHGT